MSRPFLTILAFTCVVTVLSYRTVTKLNVPGSLDEQRWGLIDFRDQIYYPVVALLHGDNPYDPVTHARHYPVARILAPYSPLSLIVHAPFGLLPLGVAEAVYYLLVLLLTLLLARFILSLCGGVASTAAVFGVATLLLLSRPGHWNLVIGQFAVQSVLATYVALYYGHSRPAIAGLALAVATFKPTFGIPLAALMIARKDIRAALIGLVVAGVLTGIATALLVHAAGGLGAFAHSIAAGLRAWSTDSAVDPVASPFRVDAAALVSRLLGRPLGVATNAAISIGVLAFAALCLRHLAGRPDTLTNRRFAASLGSLAILTSVYHLEYDGLLLALPITLLATTARWSPLPNTPGVLRWVLLGLLSVPAANYLASGNAIERLHLAAGWRLAVTSVNGLALVAALLLFAGPVLVRRGTGG